MTSDAPLSEEEKVGVSEERGMAMRAAGAYAAVQAILKDLQLPRDPYLASLNQDITRWANKALLRAWELGCE